MRRAELHALIVPLREDEGLTWAQIGKRLDIGLKYAHDIYSDPDNTRGRARRRKWQEADKDRCSCGGLKAKRADMCFECHRQRVAPSRQSPSSEPGHLWAWDFEAGSWVDVLVDIQDWERFKESPLVLSGGKAGYGRYPTCYAGGGAKGFLHRLIFDLKPGQRWPNGERVVIDHLNRDMLDNRRSNLKLCTQKENCANRGGIFESAA